LLSKLSKHLSGCLGYYAKNPSKEDNIRGDSILVKNGSNIRFRQPLKNPKFNYPPGSQPTSLILQNFHKQQVK